MVYRRFLHPRFTRVWNLFFKKFFQHLHQSV
jgi:hypothetical protein